MRTMVNVREKHRDLSLGKERAGSLTQARWTGTGLRGGSSCSMSSGTKETGHKAADSHRSKKGLTASLPPSGLGMNHV